MGDEKTVRGTEAFRRVWIVGFAGHRALTDAAAVKAAIAGVLREFRDGVEGELTGRGSAAAGADLLFLEACRELGLAYSVVLPFAEERFREDFENPAEWERVRAMIAGAANVEIATGNEGAPAAYHLAAREVIDVADAMLFVWDGQPARGIGGTAESVTEARERGLPHRIIDAASGKAGPLVQGKPLPWRDEEFASLPAAPAVERLFEILNEQAIRKAPRARSFAAGSITLNQAATVIAVILAAFVSAEKIGQVVKFFVVLAAGCLPWLGARLRLDGRWMDDRLKAELLRSLIASHAFAPPLRPFAAELFHEQVAFLRSAAWQLIGRRDSWEKEQQEYLTKRLDNQIGHYAEKGTAAERRLRVFEMLARIASLGALLFGGAAILSFLMKWQVATPVENVFLKFLPGALPAVAAWCLAMIPLFEYKRRARLYRLIVARLKGMRSELAEAKCRTTAAAVVGSCERLLLAELWEWAGAGQRK